MNLAWLQRQRKLFDSAALGCCVNYARVLSKQKESVTRVYDPRMKFEFLFSLLFSLATNLFLGRLG